MDATQNYYGTEGTISPMVLLDSAYWSETLPVEPLLRILAGDRHMGSLVAVLDRVDDVVEYLASNPARGVDD